MPDQPATNKTGIRHRKSEDLANNGATLTHFIRYF
jgi:hypothetical protein